MEHDADVAFASRVRDGEVHGHGRDRYADNLSSDQDLVMSVAEILVHACRAL